MTTTPTPLVTREALLAFTQRLVEAFAPEQVILFGSMARGTAVLESDADVLVVMPFEGRALEKILEIREVCHPEFPLDMLLWRPEDIPRRYRFQGNTLGKLLMTQSFWSTLMGLAITPP